MAQHIPFSFFGDGLSVPLVEFDGFPFAEALDIEGLNVEFLGVVVSEGSSSVTERGFVWSLGTTPTIADNKVISGSGSGSYSANITFPTLETSFYIRPYATNTEGTSYGDYFGSSFQWDTSYDPVIFSINTTAPAETASPFINSSFLNRSINARIDWGDLTAMETSSATTNTVGNITHEYAVAGTYDIRISGEFPRLGFNPTYLTEFKQWGTQPWGILYEAFRFCNFLCSATDIPVFNKTDLNAGYTGASTGGGISFMFEQTGALFTGVPNINSWDVSNINNIFGVFSYSSAFNSDISNWIPSTWSSSAPWNDYVNLSSLFSNSNYNQNLDLLDVSNVTNMSSMFTNTDLTTSGSSYSAWDISNVTSFNSMFSGASYIPTGIGSWTFGISKQVTLSGMFSGSTGTIPDITGWDTSGIRSFSSMFSSTDFNQDISGWNMTGINSGNAFGVFLSSMFWNNTAFNKDISTWDITNVRFASNFMLGVTTFSTINYDSLLIGWEAQLPGNWANLTIDFGSSQYTLGGPAETARTSLINIYGWTITDGGGI